MSAGEQAREQGLEGRARVCARRAAGAAIGEYFRLRGDANPAGSALELIRCLAVDAGAPLRARQAAEALLERVDESFNLRTPVDLLQEAADLARILEENAGLAKEG